MKINKFYLFVGLLLIVAALLVVAGIRKGSPSHVEGVFLDKVDLVESRKELPEGANVKAALEKVLSYAKLNLVENAEELGVSEENLMLQLDGVFKTVTQQKVDPYKEPLEFIRDAVTESKASSARTYYFFAALFALAACAFLIGKAMNIQRKAKEKLISSAFLVTAATSILILFLIMIFLFIEGLPIFDVVSISDFLFGSGWYPTDEDDPEFGILPLIIGSFSVTALSSAIAIPLGVMTAIYMAEIASTRVREMVKPVIELLASLPSVVIGFFGMVVVAPFLQDSFGLATGLNMFNASLMLAFMSVPTITSVSEDAIYAVPGELKEASLALGATHLETITKVILPASLSGISTAVILGMSRAIGETMVVLMVAGGAGLLPTSIFDPVRPMPASIAAEMGEAPFQSEHYYALFAIGIVLFMFTMIFNIIADHIAHKYKQVGAATL